MAPLAPTKIRTKKEKTKKQNIVSEAQPESSKPSSSKTLKRKKEVDEVDEPIMSSKKSLKKVKKDEGSPSKPAKTSKTAPEESVASSTKPVNEKKQAQSKPELPIPTSISRSRTLQSSTVTMMGKFLKGPVPEPESSVAEEDEDEDEDDISHLHGFSTDDDDSSEEEDAMDDEPSAFDVSKLPTIAKDDATIKHKLEKAKRQPTEERGVLFIGRLPHGFFEDQLKAYFSQFGNVTRLRVSRNKKTGKSKHYGFIEFDSSSVARIVADTMDNYLIMGHILRCKLIPKDQVHPELWVGANRKWRVVPRDRLTRVKHNKPRTELEQMRATKRLLKRQNEHKRKLAQAGIKYDFEAVGYKKANLVES